MKFLFIILALASGWYCQAQETILKGHIRNYNGEEIFILCRETEFQDTLQVDASGHFAWSPKLTEGQIYTLNVKDYERERIEVNLTPGNQSEIELTLLPDKKMIVKFLGDRAAENEYRMVFNQLENSSPWNTADIKSLTFLPYKKKMEEIEKGMRPLLKQVEDPEIKKQFHKELHLWYQRQLTIYGWNLSERKEGNNRDTDYDAFIKKVDLNNPEECDDFVISRVIDWHRQQEPQFGHKNRYTNELDWLERLVSNREIKNCFATQQMERRIYYASGESLEEMMKRYRQICTDDSVRQQVEAKYKKYVQAFGNLMPGKIAPDFELIDREGEKCRLSDLKGKYLFVDFWATWCHGCVLEIPYMVKLQEHFANDDRIALISVSLDSDQKLWKKFLEKDPPEWAQYVLSKEAMRFIREAYRMPGIPRFMLVNPEGYLVNFKYTRPSDPQCAELIEQDMKDNK